MEEDIIIPAPAPEETINKQSFFKEYRSLLIIAGLIITVAIVFIISSTTSTKQIVIGQPNQTITVKAGETYTITWGAKGVTSIGIVLFDGSKGSNAQWIAKGIAATKGKYDWVVAENQQSGSDYRLAVFEYPWKRATLLLIRLLLSKLLDRSIFLAMIWRCKVNGLIFPVIIRD